MRNHHILIASVFAIVPLVSAMHLAADADPRSDFDFWIGEWSVQNRDLQDDGSWKDGDVTRARITPFLGGHALLEEWSGPFHGAFMNGFSLRAYDPEREQWSIMLSWTTDGSSTFGRMNGGFRHGRAEFIAAGALGARTRFTFSDALSNTVRWDQAKSQDSGVTWVTDWIMEFTRTEVAKEMGADRFFETPWKPGEVAPHEEARALDWILGEWIGVEGGAEGQPQREARVRTALVNKDCLLVELFETRNEGSDVWVEERLAVHGYVPQADAWQSIALTRSDSVIRRFAGESLKGRMTFTEASSAAQRRSAAVEQDGADRMILQLDLGEGVKRRAVLNHVK